jgi:hypothetical protein
MYSISQLIKVFVSTPHNHQGIMGVEAQILMIRIEKAEMQHPLLIIYPHSHSQDV